MNNREAMQEEFSKYMNDYPMSATAKDIYEAGWNACLASQAQQESQAANLLLLKLEIESICDAFKYAEDAKCQIQELDVSKFLSLPPASQAQQTESKPSIEDIQSLVDSSSTMLKWCVKNVQQWSFSEYDWLRSATEKVKATLPPAPEGGDK